MTKPNAHALRLELHDPVDLDAGEPPALFTRGADPAVIGRDPTADIIVASPSVSLRHGLLTPDDGGWRYTDLHSTNGSALARGDVVEACPPGVALPIEAGDRLLLGDRSRPVEVRVLAASSGADTGAPRTGGGSVPRRTLIARAPLVDLLAPVPHGAPERLPELAALTARALTAGSPAALATLAAEAVGRLVPLAAARGVAFWGPGLDAAAGDPLPNGLRELALSGRLDAAELVVDDGDTPLPTTRSLVAAATRAALVVPLAAQGVSWGVLFAASPLGAEAFPSDVVEVFAVVGPILGLAASERSRAALEAAARAAEAAAPARAEAPVGVSPGFVEVLGLARQVAPTDVPVLIHGETGAGKEVLARYLHAESRRSAGPFVAFNCAAIPENLIESELFGHVRGAFTSAHADRKGLFEEADGGTLFIDEIGEMPLVMQAKLLRVLQDGEVRRVGAQRAATVDVRIVSATHRDLVALAKAGTFRADLMYRLNAVTLTLPPLRERPEDIPILAHLFLARAAARCGKTFPGFSPAALWALSMHAFPGNVRELDNEVLRAAALTPDGCAIGPDAFSPRLRDAAPAVTREGAAGGVLPLKEAVANAERAAIEAALAEARGNVSEAARLLEVTRPGLYKTMERLGLKP